MNQNFAFVLAEGMLCRSFRFEFEEKKTSTRAPIQKVFVITVRQLHRS